MVRITRIAIVTLAINCCILVSSLYADTVFLNFNVDVDPPGPQAPIYADGAIVTVTDLNGNEVGSGEVVSGVAGLNAELTPGVDYRYFIQPATQNATYQKPGGYLPFKITIALQADSNGPNFYCDSGFTYCDFNIVLNPALYYRRIVVTDTNSDPIPNAYVYFSGECGFPNKRNAGVLTDAQGSAWLGVVDNDPCDYGVSVSKSGFVDLFTVNHPDYTENNLNVFVARDDLVLEAPDATITINVLDPTGKVLPLKNNDSIDARCAEVGVPNPKEYFGSLFPDQEPPKIEIPIVNGTYDCEVNFFTAGLYNIELPIDEVIVQNGVNPDPIQAVVKEFKETLNVTLYDEDGVTVHYFTESPEEYGVVSCGNELGTKHFDSFIEPGSPGNFPMGIVPGKWHCNAFVDGYSSTGVNLNVLPNQKNKPLNIQLLKLDSTITVNLKNADNSSFTTHDGAHVHCHDSQSDFGQQFSGFGDPGLSSFPMPGLDGSFECYLHIDGYAGALANLTATNGFGEITFTVDKPLQGTLTVRVVDDTTGELVKIPLNYFIHPKHEFGENSEDEVVFHDGELSSSGEVSFPVPLELDLEAGISEPFDRFGKQEAQPIGPNSLAKEKSAASSYTVQDVNGDVYFIPYQPKSFRVDANTKAATVEFRLVKPTTFVQITLLNAAGTDVIQDGFVDAISFDLNQDNGPIDNKPPANEFDDRDHFIGAPLVNGSAIVPILLDRNYDFVVMPLFEQGSRIVPPASQSLTLTAADGEFPYNAPYQLTFQVKEANHDLTIDIQTETSSASILADTVQETHCFAFQEGVPVFIPEIEGNSITIPLVVEEDLQAWEVGCHRIAGNEETEQYKSFVGHSFYSPQKDTTTGSITVTLKEDNDYFPPKELTFDVSKDATLRFHEVVISVPATAFGSSGTGKLKISSASSITYSEDSFPTLALDFTWTVDGQLITTPSLPVTVKFPVDLAKLEELGVSLNSLFAGHFNTDTNKWVKDGSISITTVVNETTGEAKSYATITMSSFSAWGTIVNKAKELKNSVPTDLKGRKKVKRVKGPNIPNKVKYFFEWTPPTNAIEGVTEYEVDVKLKRKKKSKNKKKKKKKKKKNNNTDDWSKAKTYLTKENFIMKKFVVGNVYEFRVRVKSGTNSTTKTVKIKGPKLKKASNG